MTPVAETISSYASGRSVTSRSIVQARTCSALPMPAGDPLRLWNSELPAAVAAASPRIEELGRASCRDRGCQDVYVSVVAVSLKKKKTYIKLKDTNKHK